MNTHRRIVQLMEERSWTAYRLAKEAGLPQSTITNLFKRSTTPSIPTLETICKGFGITMAQFFAEGNFVELSEEQQKFFHDWALLSKEDKLLVEQLVKKLKASK